MFTEQKPPLPGDRLELAGPAVASRLAQQRLHQASR
jgi:hypothetical protein